MKRVDPFDMDKLFKEMEKRFQEMNRYQSNSGRGLKGFLPVDIEEKEEDIIVKADMPGMSKEDIKVKASEGNLEIRAESSKEIVEENEKYLRKERGKRSYKRNVSLPERVKTEGVEASYENGVLKVTLPKKESDKKKDVEVK